MKTTIAYLIYPLLTTSLLGIDAPSDVAEPPPNMAQPQAQEAARPQPQVREQEAQDEQDAPPAPGVQERDDDGFMLVPKIMVVPRGRNAASTAPFLGVACEPIPDVLSEQMNIPKNSGIVVKRVAPDSSASKSDIRANDIIRNVNGKVVATSQELSKAVASCKPGDKIKVGVLRKGKEEQKEVTLSATPKIVANQQGKGILALDGVQGLPMLDRDGGIQGMMINDPQIRRLMQNLQMGMDQQMQQMQQMGAMEKNMQDRLKRLQARPQDRGNKMSFSMNSFSVCKVCEGGRTYELRTADGGKELTVKENDKNGQEKVVWQGPWDNDADKTAAPEEVQDAAERIFDKRSNIMNLFHDK